MSVRTRFSPSPTGHLHIGGARTTLFSALYAAKHQGQFILRIEDTDLARSEERYMDSQIADLKWLGIHWQEGPHVAGDYGPYRQSERQAIYEKYYAILEEKQQMYRCFCSDQELMLARKIQLSRGQAPRYSGKCRQLSQEEIEQKIASGEKPAWRFIVPSGEEIQFTDGIKGLQVFKSADIGDFIIRRADGSAPFLFCNAVDDALMKISHVIRGEDHLANTPRQILLLKNLNLPIPQYAHLALIVGEDGAKLSKRHGSFSVNEMREQGYLALAIINYLSRLGHAGESQALLPFQGLAENFYLEKISRSAARFDQSQLLYWQKMAVQALDAVGLKAWLGDTLMQSVPATKQSLFVETIRANVAFPEEAREWVKIFFEDPLLLDEESMKIIREAGEVFFKQALLSIDKFGTKLTEFLAEMKQALSIQGKKLFMPLRVALTGKQHGPELAQIVELLGVEKVKERFQQALDSVK